MIVPTSAPDVPGGRDALISSHVGSELGLPGPVRTALGGILVARLATNGGLRVVYPFVPIIAVGLGVSLQTMALLLAGRSLAGLAGPALARVNSPNRWYPMMLGSQIMVASGSIVIVLAADLPPALRIVTLAMGFGATGLARPLFDLPVQAWLTTRVALSGRGRAFGVVELAWALSLAVTVPLAGVLIDRSGWQSAFMVIIGLTLIGMAVIRAVVSPHIRIADQDVWQTRYRATSTDSLSQVADDKVCAAAVCLATGLVITAGELLFVTYGAWLIQDFGLSISEIGISTVLIVTAELAGGFMVIAVSDRVGLHRTLGCGLLVSSLAYASLGAVGHSIPAAVVAIGAWFVAFEATVVTLVAMAGTAGPGHDHHTEVFGWQMAAIACGNAVGAAAAPSVFSHGGIAVSGLVAAACTVAAGAVLWHTARSTDDGSARRRPLA